MKKGGMITLTVIGFAFIAAGLIYLKTTDAAHGIMAVLPYLSIGVGCGAFGHGIGELVSSRALKSDPEIQKQLEIEQKDERNVEIANRAKGKAYDSMLYIFGALMISFVLMDIPIYVTLLFVLGYIVVAAIEIYYRSKYEKEM